MKGSRYARLPQYEARGYPENELEKIQELFSRAFGGRRETGEMLRWQMEENPSLKKRATSLWDGDTLVAYNALTPAKAVYEGRRIYTAVSGTTMANERYMGVSVQLFSECSKQNQDIEVIIGFPNHNSYGITTKYLNHKYIGDVAFWTCKAHRTEFCGDIRRISAFTDEHGGLWKGLSGRHQYMKIRDRDYLNWRFLKRPEYEYQAYELVENGRICGYIVTDVYVENQVRQLQLVDFVALSEESLSALLRFCLDLVARLKCELVKAWMTSGYYKQVFLDAGFVYGNHPFPMTVWEQGLELEKAYLTMCDSDIF